MHNLGWGASRIAREMGVSEGGVRGVIQRAKRREAG
jgi:DNA-directed RNA polymerase specialized sigma24 family protein